MKVKRIFKLTAVALIASFALAACKKDVTGVTLNRTAATIAPGETLTLTATVQPEKAANKNVRWSSSDSQVASVNNGVVTAVKEGTATITVTTEDGNKTAKCFITVGSPTPAGSMVLKHSTVYTVLFMAGRGTVTIDWGDGTVENHPLIAADEGDMDDFMYYRTYSSSTPRTVTISGGTITHFMCFENELTHLDVSKNTALEMLVCADNLLTSLDVSKNTALEVLACSDNMLTSLDVSKNTALEALECSFNKITHLDVSKNTALENLSCWDNRLTSLDVSKNILLEWLDLDDNLFSGTALNATFGTLRSNPMFGILYISGNPGEFECNVSIAENKGWTVYGGGYDSPAPQLKSRIVKEKAKPENAFLRVVKAKQKKKS